MRNAKLAAVGTGLLLTAIGVARAGPLVVYPLGDSITYGLTANVPNGATPGGYRGTAYADLNSAGFAVRFVGTRTDNPSVAMTAGGTVQHDGWSGIRIEQVAANVNAWLATGGYGGLQPSNAPAYPNCIFVHLGTNDVLQHFDDNPAFPNNTESEAQFRSDMDARLASLVDQLTTQRPGAAVLVAQIIPINNPALNPEVIAYNQYIHDTLVPAEQGLGRHVSLVNQYANFQHPDGTIDATNLSDGVHPNAVGYAAMGHTWAAAVQATQVPEPGSSATVGAGLVVLHARHRRRRAAVA